MLQNFVHDICDSKCNIIDFSCQAVLAHIVLSRRSHGYDGMADMLSANDLFTAFQIFKGNKQFLCDVDVYLELKDFSDAVDNISPAPFHVVKLKRKDIFSIVLSAIASNETCSLAFCSIQLKQCPVALVPRYLR